MSTLRDGASLEEGLTCAAGHQISGPMKAFRRRDNVLLVGSLRDLQEAQRKSAFRLGTDQNEKTTATRKCRKTLGCFLNYFDIQQADFP